MACINLELKQTPWLDPTGLYFSEWSFPTEVKDMCERFSKAVPMACAKSSKILQIKSFLIGENWGLLTLLEHITFSASLRYLTYGLRNPNSWPLP